MPTARGTIAAVHVLCNELAIGETLHVKVTCRGQKVAGAVWYRLVDVPVDHNTGRWFGLEKEEQHNPYVIRRAPFRIYDAMAPMPSTLKVEASTIALRLHLPVSPDVLPGIYDYLIELSICGTTEALCLRLDVHAPVIPQIGAQTFPYTNWFSYQHIADRHGLTLWSPAYWRMLGEYARLMAHGRQNMFWLPLEMLFDDRTLNMARLKRLVRLFTDAGMHWIEGGHIASHFHDGDYHLAITGQPVMSVEGHATLARLLRQLHGAIMACGWEERWLQHAIDEPCGEACTAYRIAVGIVHKYLPNVPVIDAVMDPALVGAANILVIQNDQVREQLPHFLAQREFGDHIWLYTCMGPGGNGLNRLLDMELLRATLLGWACVACGFDGFLHWGLNHYRGDQNPFRQSIADCLPAGDTHIVYPGPDGPWSSVRLEAQREGMEDVELLRELQQRNPNACTRIVRTVVRDCWDYTKDVAVLDTARRRLYRALK